MMISIFNPYFNSRIWGSPSATSDAEVNATGRGSPDTCIVKENDPSSYVRKKIQSMVSFPILFNGSMSIGGTPPDHSKLKETFANFTAGVVQATLVTATGHPLDLVKVRLQSGMYTSTIDCFKDTVQKEGLIGLYRGASMPLLSHMMKRPIQYPISEYLKSKMTTEVGDNANSFKTTASNYAIGAFSGMLGPVFGTPLQVVKISMQTTTASSVKNSWAYIKHNYKQNGFLGFYRGFIPTVVKDSIFGMSFVGTYYTLRDTIGADHWYKNFFNGATAHCITWYLFIPIDYVKTAIQKSEARVRIGDVIRDSYSRHGIRVFWKGVLPACVRTIPVSGIAMIGYEQTRKFIMGN